MVPRRESSPLKEDSIRIGVIDVGFNELEDLRGRELPEAVVSLCESSANPCSEHLPCEVQGTSCHAVFGKVTNGMDVVLAIQQGDVMESVDIHKK